MVRSTSVSRWGLVAAALATFALGVFGLVQVDDARRAADARSEAAATTAEAAIEAAARVDGAARDLERLAASAATISPEAISRRSLPGISGISVVDRPADPLVVAGPLADRILDNARFRRTTARARDTGMLQLVPPISGQASVWLIAPLYRSGGAVTDRPPSSTESRRASVDSYVVAAVDLLDLASGDVEVSVDGSPLARSGTGSDGETASADFRLVGRTWSVSSTVPVSGAWSGWTLVVVAVAVLGTSIVVTAWLVQDRVRRRIERELSAENERNKVVRDLAPMLQRSLHLEDVLPAMAIQLADRFDLAGVAVVASEPGSGPAQVFRHGSRPDASRGIHVERAIPVAAGRTALLTLTRGGRLVAELQFVPSRDLEATDIEGIHASAELVTSAIVTARALDGQRAAVEELTELDSLKTVFLSTAAHELKTPLAAILGLSGIVEGHWDELSDDDRRVMAGRVAANARSLDLLVRDLLDFSRLETGELEVETHPIDLGDEVAAIVERQAAAWGTHDIEVEVEPGPPVAADRTAIERIVANIVSNAVKYSPEGTTVHVRVRHTAQSCELIIDDQGPGIDEAERRRVFERFYRGTGPVVVRTRGVGIGLSVVREFVRQLDGEIEIDTAPTGGARFVCRFPHVDDVVGETASTGAGSSETAS